MKKVLFLFWCAITVFAVKGNQYLYWQVTQTDADDAAIAFQGADLFAVVEDQKIQVVHTLHVGGKNELTTETSGWQMTRLDDLDLLLQGDLLASTTSFYIELQNYEGGNWTPVGMSEIKTYADLVAMNAIAGLGSVTSGYAVTPWNPAVTAAAPEPSSGLLILVGGALLALRRRKRA